MKLLDLSLLFQKLHLMLDGGALHSRLVGPLKKIQGHL